MSVTESTSRALYRVPCEIDVGPLIIPIKAKYLAAEFRIVELLRLPFPVS